MNFLRIRYVSFFNSILAVLTCAIWLYFKKEEMTQEAGEEVVNILLNRVKCVGGTAITVLCNISQIVVFGLYLYHDILEFKGKYSNYRKKLKRRLDFVFYYIISGNSLTVTVVFWIFHHFGPDSVYPLIPGTNTMLKPPVWLNHVMHSLNMVNVVLHAYQNQISPSSSVPIGLPLTLLHTFYVIWVYLCHRLTGLWLYPLFDVDEPHRIFMFLCFILSSRYAAEIVYHLNAYYCNFKSRKTGIALKES